MAESPIITFYSPRAGVGNTVTMAQVASILARDYGLDVLAVDMNLNAPSLQEYFGISQEDVGCGFFDMILNYKELLKHEIDEIPEPLTDVNKYIKIAPLDLDKGSVSIIPAGIYSTCNNMNKSEDYYNAVNSFDWNNFYDKWHGYGYLKYLKQQFKDAADVVLVDGGSGFNTPSLIALMDVADDISIQFAYNNTNIKDLDIMVKNISNKNLSSEICLRPSFINTEDIHNLNKWGKRTVSALKRYIPSLNINVLRANTIPYDVQFAAGGCSAIEELPENIKAPYSRIAKDITETIRLS